jgi:predicted O-methyltransferase YrrM
MNGKPWFSHCSIEFLEGRIQPGWLCFEWGSGGSTIWLAELGGQLVSVEHNDEWYSQVDKWLIEYGLKVDLNYIQLTSGYADFILKYPDDHFDLIEIDGRQRAACTQNALPKLKPGGILIVDNSEREQYQESLATVRRWEHVDFYSGNSEGWTTSVYFKPKE